LERKKTAPKQKGGIGMARFTLPRDLYHGKGSIDELKNLSGKKAIVVVGGGSMKKFGFLDKVTENLKAAGMQV
jgi:alcohol dehydrogenase YqhD (iron-dependent ADH family)